METCRDDDRLTAELRAIRPLPNPEFTVQLDERAAAGFPRRSGAFAPAGSFAARLLEWLRSLSSRQLLVPTGGVALVAIAAATVFLVSSENETTPLALHSLTEVPAEVRATPGNHSDGSRHYSGASRQHFLGRPRPGVPSAGGAAEAEGASGVMPSEESASAALSQAPPVVHGFNSSFSPRHRDVERSAEVVLAASPEDVADDVARVFEAVHANRGVVLRSSTREGAEGAAGATFELLIPSGKLPDALAAFSAIDEVRSRHEATADITAPTANAAELLQQSRARIDSLLGQLEGAETEEEREAVEAELRHERRHAGRLAAQLTRLHRRADLSRVSVQIVTGGTDPAASGGWGGGDALHDAGRILAVAAAVALVALAIIGPIALVALLAWLSQRAWVRRQRRRALG